MIAMFALDLNTLSATDVVATYAAIVATGTAIIEFSRYLRERLKITLQATSKAFYEGDFAEDVDPQTMWQISAIIRNTGGLPVAIERAEYVTYSNVLFKWLRKPLKTFEAGSKLPADLDAGKIYQLPLVMSDQTFGERANGTKLWLAIYHSRSNRPLLAALSYRKLSGDERSAMWSSYDGDLTAEQEATLERVYRKQHEQSRARRAGG